MSRQRHILSTIIAIAGVASGLVIGQLTYAACEAKCKEFTYFTSRQKEAGPGADYVMLSGEELDSCMRIIFCVNGETYTSGTFPTQKKYKQLQGDYTCTYDCFYNGGVNGMIQSCTAHPTTGSETTIYCWSGCTNGSP